MSIGGPTSRPNTGPVLLGVASLPGFGSLVHVGCCAALRCRAVKYLYDGDCAMCRSLKAVLERQDNRQGLISFIDISDLYYDPLAVGWIRVELLNCKQHSRDPLVAVAGAHAPTVCRLLGNQRSGFSDAARMPVQLAWCSALGQARVQQHAGPLRGADRPAPTML